MGKNVFSGRGSNDSDTCSCHVYVSCLDCLFSSRRHVKSSFKEKLFIYYSLKGRRHIHGWQNGLSTWWWWWSRVYHSLTPTTLGRPVNARFMKRFSHRHSVCLCIFYHVYEGFVVLVLGGASTPFFMGPKRCLSQFETRDLVEYPFVFFDLCDIPQKPSPEASTQASLRRLYA